MNVQPVASPHQAITPNSTPTAAQDARAKAIAAFTKAQEPQVNQNAISPEEFGAVKQKMRQEPSENEQLAGQNNSDEVPAEQTPEDASAPVEESAKEQETPALSSQYAALARREKALRANAAKQDQAFKAREAALATKEAELTAKGTPQAPDYSNYISKDLFNKDPIAALQQAESSYEKLTQQILDQGNMDPRVERMHQALEAKIAKLEAELADGKKSQESAQAESYKTAVAQITQDVKQMVKADPTYEMIKVTNSYKDVVELIEATFKDTGRLMTNEEAAQEVEDYLTEQAEKLAKTNKIRSRLQPAASTQAKAQPVQKPVDQKQLQTQQKSMTTLTNASSRPRQMSAKERAIAAFRGEKI